jgi:hypothetical protein
MKTTKISVSYSETASLPGYNNIRPSVGFEVEVTGVADDQTPMVIAAELFQKAKSMVKEEIRQEKLLREITPYVTGENQQEFDWSQPPLEPVDGSGDTNLVREPQSSAAEDEEELPF